ncbi:MarR family transcriptional regulator [Candidatus Nitrososphaera sp. FF02]|uniref:MarR family transcriptional regulator n=1 Tax=Candidatus Nitrososphaera sp. FF02 TaxID=3398226 RepID=UPI0039ED4941
MSNVADSPKHFIVLDAVSRGMNEVGKIAKVTKMDKAEVELVVNDLTSQRLLMADEKRGLLGKKLQVEITETGKSLLADRKKELEEKAGELRGMYRNGDRRGVQSFMDDNRAWLPMMIFSGLMSALMFASIMSFAGMAMNPAEASMADDAGAQEATADSGSSDSSSDSTDAGADSGADAGGDVGFEGDVGGGDF